MTATAKHDRTDAMTYDWEGAPIAEAEQRLAKLRSALQHADTVMQTRRSTPSPTYICWTQSMLAEHYPDGSAVISVATRPACKKEGVSGREAFRDDGAKDEYGNRITIRCCGYQCFQDYQRYKGSQRIFGASAPTRDR